MTAMLPAHLTESVNSLGDAAKAMTEEIRQERAERKRYNKLILALLLVVAVLVAGLVIISVANRRLGVANAELNRQNSRIVERIDSCTNVDGECYKQGVERTQAVAQQLFRANIAVAICARTETEPDAIEACALARVTQPSETGESPPSGTGPDGEPVPDPEPQPEPTG